MPSENDDEKNKQKKHSDFKFNFATLEEVNYSALSEYFVSKVEYEELKLKFGELEKGLKKVKSKQTTSEKLIFPKKVFDELPNPIKKVIDGIKLNYEHNYPDFCCWGIRKALTIGIDIKFKKEGKENMLFDDSGEPYGLPKKIELAKQKKYLNSNLANQLRKEAKVFGDIASHDYMTKLHKEDVPSNFRLLRLALGRMYSKEK